MAGVPLFVHALTLHRALRRMAGLVFLFDFLGAGGRLPKARRGRVCCTIHHHHHRFCSRRPRKINFAAPPWGGREGRGERRRFRTIFARLLVAHASRGGSHSAAVPSVLADTPPPTGGHKGWCVPPVGTDARCQGGLLSHHCMK